jgi:Tol biopolymer transport system component
MDGMTLSSDAVLEALEKVSSSGVFRHASRSSKLLRFLVTETLNGKADRLKDYTLGAEALGRGVDFDPRIDPIARAEASRLRSRLELYYATEGASDVILITLPKGGYVPVFEKRSTDNTSSTAPRHRERLIWGALALLAMIALTEGFWLWRLAGNGPVASEMRLEITTPPTTDPISMALSPHGDQIVFVATSGSRSQLWLRRFDSVSAQPLAGTDYASFPFWSPDGRSIGFLADSKLKRIDIDGGSVQVLTKALVPAGGTWNQDGLIVFPMVPNSALFGISAKGGEPSPLTQLEPQQTGHIAPQFLPDGRHFLYYATGDPKVKGIYVGEIGKVGSRRLLDADTSAVYASSGHLFFVRQGTLFAQNINLDRLEVSGNAHPVAEGLIFSGEGGIAPLSASALGTIAYRAGSSRGKRQFIWFDRSGRRIGTVGNPESSDPAYASISPDYRRLALQRTSSGNPDIWLLDLKQSVATRFTSAPEAEIVPIWSPNGDRIVFSSLRNGKFDLFQKLVAGNAAAEPLLVTPQAKQATDWSSDGRFLLFRSLDPKSDWDIWALPMTGDQKPFPAVQTEFEERDGQFSPDGKWIAYQSNESGRFEIYIRPFPGPGERWRVSKDGGVQVRWRRDGGGLFYIDLDGQLVEVPFKIVSTSQAAEIGMPIPLFVAPVGAVQNVSLQHYNVSADAQKFLLQTILEEPAPPITVILNWKAP